MRKINLILLLIVLFSSIDPSFALFNKQKQKPAMILTSSDLRIETNKNIQNETVFKKDERIYFAVFSPRGFKSDYIKYQIVRQDDNAHVGGYTRIRNITKRTKDKNYFTDYFVLSQAGKYIIQIFDITNLHQWLAISQFRVIDE